MVQYGIFPFSEVSFGSIFPDSFSDNGLSFDDAHSRWTSAYEIFSRITFLIFMLSGAFFAIARIIPEKFASTWSQTSKIESYEVTE
jgi:hypothetical protein